MIFFITFCFSCKDNDDSIALEDQRKTEGFVVVGVSEDESTTFVRYFKEMPSGTIDLTEGQSFQNFFLADVYDGAIYGQRTDGANGFSKLAVDGNGLIVEEGILPTTGENAFVIRVRDSNTGIFIDPNDITQVKVFDPQAFQETGNIDLSGADVFSDSELFATSAVFRDDDVFIALSKDGLLDNYTMVRGSISSGNLGNQLNSTTGSVFPFNPIFRGTYESGNLYVHYTGSISPFGTPGGVLKIPAGSNEFDPNYNFSVVLDNTLLLQTVRAFGYHQNGIGYALIAVDTPQGVVDIITAAGGVGNLTQEQINQILFLLSTEPNGAWVEVDLNTETVVKQLPGLPKVSSFARTNIMFIDDLPHFALQNTVDNAFYRYNPTTSQSEKLFDVTGANITHVIDLSRNNLR